MQCEVCGTELVKLHVHVCGKSTEECIGPLYEQRRHWRGDTFEHQWYQLHNCVRPDPDACYFCGDEPNLGKIPYRCC